MTVFQKLALRAAVHIRQQLAGANTQPDNVSIPDGSWSECQRLVARIEQVQRRGWLVAAEHLRTQLRGELSSLTAYSESALRGCLAQSLPAACPTLRQIYADLLALPEEFEDVDIRLRENTLVVRTEPIELKEVDFGPFEIRLQWKHLGKYQPYEVVALSPYPATSNPTVTHPHVQDNSLCSGEGRMPIQQALRQGRLGDFFLIVQQVLKTYSSASAFVTLDCWSGTRCTDCGEVRSDDDSFHCRSCDSVLCPGCSRDCTTCATYFCSDCVSVCDACDSECCHSCQLTCELCNGGFCDQCLSAGYCKSCRKHNEETPAGTARPEASGDNSSATPPTEYGAGAPVLALSVGQAALPA